MSRRRRAASPPRVHRCPRCESGRADTVSPHGLTAFERRVLLRLNRRTYRCLDCGRRFHDRPLQPGPRVPRAAPDTSGSLAQRVLSVLRVRPAVWIAGLLPTAASVVAMGAQAEVETVLGIGIGTALLIGLLLWLDVRLRALRRFPSGDAANRRAAVALCGAYIVVSVFGGVVIAGLQLMNQLTARKQSGTPKRR